jgi:hypothetical protein
MNIFGTGRLIKRGAAILSVNKNIEKVEITSGRIHRYDTRITGSEALANLRNRRERIDAIVEWMNTGEGYTKGQSINDFNDYWKPILLPEMVPGKKRPTGWQKNGDVFQKAEDIRWNTSYTERIFPDTIWPVRNSGTLLRDWEEAISWIYIEYEWEKITELLSQNTILVKK